MIQLQPRVETQKTKCEMDESISSIIRSAFQLRDGDRRAAVVFGFVADRFDQGVRGQKLRQTPAEGPSAVAVDDANRRPAGQRGHVQKFVHALGGLFDRVADDVDFAFRGLLGGARLHGDSARVRSGSGF